MTFVKSVKVVCAIIEKDGKFLAARRKYPEALCGFWEFPGGKIDPGEDPEHAIKREIREELGVEVTVKYQLPSTAFKYPDKTVLLIPFVCESGSGPFISLEHEEIRWMDKTDAQLLDWLPADIEILRNYLTSARK
jgi:8-oxo-dGTP diphosphatase